MYEDTVLGKPSYTWSRPISHLVSLLGTKVCCYFAEHILSNIQPLVLGTQTILSKKRKYPLL